MDWTRYWERPGRRMPSLKRIAEHWGLGSEPHCFRCGRYAPECTWQDASRYLDRAHIIDRACDGLDGPQNLLPLCKPCHRIQPMFEPGHENDALAWFGWPEIPYLINECPPDCWSCNRSTKEKAA